MTEFEYLNDPFSPFSVALRNIRTNIITKKIIDKATKPEKYITDLLLNEILNLSIPIKENIYPKIRIEFPIVAYWHQNDENPEVVYRGGYDKPSSLKEREKTDNKSNSSRKVLENLINQIKYKNEFHVTFEHPGDPEFDKKRFLDLSFYKKDKWLLPESIRELQGYYFFEKTDSKEFPRFLLIYKLIEDEKSERLILDGDMFETLDWFFIPIERFIYEKYRDLFILVSLKQGKSVNYIIQNYGYPGLRNILSNLQDEVEVLERGSKASNQTNRKESNAYDKDTLKNEFSVVFVRPSLTADGKFCFKYILTHRQIELLESYIKEHKFTQLIRDKENKISRELSIEIQNPIVSISNPNLKNKSFNKLSNFEPIIIDLITHLGEINNYSEEILRKLIYLSYAFHKTTIKEFNNKLDLSNKTFTHSIESDEGSVKRDQAFLITRIFESRRPDIVGSMINHPFSKTLQKQYKTKHLINLYTQKFKDNNFYPRFLHLFETLVFPDELFMYPVYQFGAPVLLCAFDANFYTLERQSLKTKIDRHIPGLFSATIESILTDADNKLYETIGLGKTQTVYSLQEKQESYEKEAKKLVKKLLIHFSDVAWKIDNIDKNLLIKYEDKKDSDKEFVPVIEEKNIKMEIEACNKYIEIRATDDLKFFNEKEHPDVKALLEMNLNLYLEMFGRIWRNAELLEESQRTSKLSAVSTVMARNMSHNIGSHVLEQLSKEDNIKDTRQVAILNSYLRTRMDFLADIATSTASVTMAKKLYQDIILYFKPSDEENNNIKLKTRWPRLLIDHISGGAKLQGVNGSLDSNRIKIIVKLDDVTIVSGYRNDPIVAFPNDFLGAHALYVIFENLIRNCAKHSIIKDALEITVSLIDVEDYYRVSVFDNLGQLNNRNENIKDDLNKSISSSILEDGSLRQGGWGVLEMKIAAAYLRRISLDKVDAYKANEELTIKNKTYPPLLTAVVDNNDNLGYEFYLVKPKIALILCEEEIIDDEKSFWYMNGIRFIKISNWQKQFKLLDYGSKYDFIVLIDPTKEILDKKYESGKRVLVYKKNTSFYAELINAFSSFDISKMNKILYKKRAIDLCPNGLPDIYINDSHQWQYCQENDLSIHSSNIVLFDKHGDLLQQRPDYYYELYGSTSPTGLIINNLDPPDDKYDRFLFELVETVCTKVAIVDERIQKKAETQDVSLRAGSGQKINKKLIELLKWMKINIIPEKSVILNEQSFDKKIQQKIENWIEKLLQDSDTDFLLIHLGIIEKIVGTNINDIGSWLEKFESICMKSNKSIVVISGRGRPSNLPKKTIFLHYSIIARYLIEERSKYHLCKVLYSARRKK